MKRWFLTGPWDIHETVAAGELPKVIAHVFQGHGTSPEERTENARLLVNAPAMHQRLVFAQRLLLQGDTEGALKEINLGLQGEYEES